MNKNLIAVLGLGIIVGGFTLTSFADGKQEDNLDKFRVQNVDQLKSKEDLSEYSQEDMIQYCIENMGLSAEQAENMRGFMRRPGGCH